MQVVLITPSSNVLALGQPVPFMENYINLQDKYRSIRSAQQTKIIFAAAREEFAGPYERHRLPVTI
jgi:hypothetical protein